MKCALAARSRQGNLTSTQISAHPLGLFIFLQHTYLWFDRRASAALIPFATRTA